jgi:hypothetical protein
MVLNMFYTIYGLEKNKKVLNLSPYPRGGGVFLKIYLSPSKRYAETVKNSKMLLK